MPERESSSGSFSGKWTSDLPGIISHGWLRFVVPILLTIIVVMGGMWSIWRASKQEQQIGEMRETLRYVDDMLRRRTQFFEQIEGNQLKIMADINFMLKDQTPRFERIEATQTKVLDHIRREEAQWKQPH